MSPFKLFFFAFFSLLPALTVSAQIKQLSLSGTYAPIINTINITEINYKAFGVSIEYEYKSRKHLSFGMEVDWQKYNSQTVFVKPYQASNHLLIRYAIERYQVNIRPIFRYYWKEGFQGVYVGVFGAYSALITRPKESPNVIGYPKRMHKSPYNSAGGCGLTYGYRFKLTPSLKLSAFVNHQFVFNDIYDDNGAHQDHQFGLGLNWLLGIGHIIN